jgi:hypothetical protein
MSHPEEPPITAYDLTDPGDRRKSFEDQCQDLRHHILECAELVRLLLKHPHLENPLNGPGVISRQELNQALEYNQEICDNVMLAYRHLEDARMRLGKAIQASDGGASLYKD